MKKLIYATATIISLFLICCEADTMVNQILWSGSWMLVCGLSAKALGNNLTEEEKEERV